MRHLLLFVVIALCIIGCTSTSNHNQETQESHVIAFYNLENLFDTINNEGVNDGEFTPDGFRNWNTERYISKQNKMSKVIADIGSDQNFDAPSIIGLCEMENQAVLNDLINTDQLKDKNYSIIHFDSPDQRGIDVALLYKANIFKVTGTQLYPLIIQDSETGKRLHTRDQLLVSGELEGDLIHLIVNHWPSRYGGLERSIPSRKAAALLNRHIIDSLLHTDKNAKIITMGDLNDDPEDVSVTTHLNAHISRDDLNDKDLYNPLATNHKNGSGSLYYRGKWNLFDQMIISQGLLNAKSAYQYDTAYIYNKPNLIQQEGNFKGHLLRTFGGKTYLDGYSDHLPVYMVLSKK